MATRLLELLSHSSEPLAKLVDGLPQLFNTPELRVAVPDEQKRSVVAKMADSLRRIPGTEVIELDGVRVTWPDAWALVRASNTQPAVSLRFEADSELRLRSVQGEVQALLKRTLAELPSPTTLSSEPGTKQPAGQLTFYYDLGSAYCYLLMQQLPELLERCQASVRFVPAASCR